VRVILGENVFDVQVLPKRKRLVKEAEYFDDGCEYSPSCLRCPLPVCKHDDPVAALVWAVPKNGVQLSLDLKFLGGEKECTK